MQMEPHGWPHDKQPQITLWYSNPAYHLFAVNVISQLFEFLLLGAVCIGKCPSSWHWVVWFTVTLGRVRQLHWSLTATLRKSLNCQSVEQPSSSGHWREPNYLARWSRWGSHRDNVKSWFHVTLRMEGLFGQITQGHQRKSRWMREWEPNMQTISALSWPRELIEGKKRPLVIVSWQRSPPPIIFHPLKTLFLMRKLSVHLLPP